METKELIFALSSKDIRLKVVANVEALITNPEDEDKVPCWAEIWPAARGISHWVWNNLSFHGEDLLELGAGLGLPGIVCALKGAVVTFSDFNPSALELAIQNAEINGVHTANKFLGDWRKFNLKQRYKWILCSDVTYDPKLNIYILNIIQNNLSPGGNLLVAHPGRPATFEFLNNLEKIFNWQKINTEIPISIDDPYFPHYNIHIHHWEQLD